VKTFDDLRNELQQEDLTLYIVMEIVGKLIATRDRKGLSQRELSKISGIPQKTISRIESGKDIPKIPTLYRLASSLELDLEIKVVDKEIKEERTPTLLL
jgi:transcriptional regulator with XRE-family HTH domain